MNELSTAYITQHTGNQGKSAWVVFNQNKEALVELPSHLNEHEAMDILMFARKYELKAFNAGIEYNKSKLHEDNVKALQECVRELRKENLLLLEQNELLLAENERIGDALDKEVSK